MGIIWDELTVIFMCLVAKQKYRLETGCSELHNTVFFANGGLNVHNLNRWTWALLIPTKDSDTQKRFVIWGNSGTDSDTAEADGFK